jgi:hypothetical protein
VRRGAGGQGGVPACLRRTSDPLASHGLTSRSPPLGGLHVPEGSTLPSAARVSGGRAQLHSAIVLRTNSRPHQRAPFQRSSCTVAWSCTSLRRAHAEGIRHTSSPEISDLLAQGALEVLVPTAVGIDGEGFVGVRHCPSWQSEIAWMGSLGRPGRGSHRFVSLPESDSSQDGDRAPSQPRPLGRTSSRTGKVAGPVEGLGGGSRQGAGLRPFHLQFYFCFDGLGGLVFGVRSKTTSSLTIFDCSVRAHSESTSSLRSGRR